MAAILEQAVDIALDQKDLKRKYERRIERAAKREGDQGVPSKSRPGEISARNRFNGSRYITSAVRERVHARANYQCEYRGPDGTRCRSRTGLEIEHVRPFALFRDHDERFLKAYCRAHNRLAAESFYGAAFIQDKIKASRERRNSRQASGP
jgi:hypothetical protein